MNKYQVFWTQAAMQDLKNIIEYIESDSETQAGKIYLQIKQQASDLNRMPLRGRVVPELNYFNIIGYRELISPSWRIIYRVEADKVWVLAVIDGRRNAEDLLLDRLMKNNR